MQCSNWLRLFTARKFCAVKSEWNWHKWLGNGPERGSGYNRTASWHTLPPEAFLDMIISYTRFCFQFEKAQSEKITISKLREHLTQPAASTKTETTMQVMFLENMICWNQAEASQSATQRSKIWTSFTCHSFQTGKRQFFASLFWQGNNHFYKV